MWWFSTHLKCTWMNILILTCFVLIRCFFSYGWTMCRKPPARWNSFVCGWIFKKPIQYPPARWDGLARGWIFYYVFSCVLPCKIFFTKLNFLSCVPTPLTFYDFVSMSFCFSEKSLFCEILFRRRVRGFWRQMQVYILLCFNSFLPTFDLTSFFPWFLHLFSYSITFLQIIRIL